jgi:hypothetical protein
MIDIQCSEVVRGQVTLTWKPSNEQITDFIKNQIGDDDLSFLFRVESEGDILHEFVNIRQGEHTIFLKAPGEQKIKVFPVRFNRDGGKNLLKSIPEDTFETFESFDHGIYYNNLRYGFKHFTALLMKNEFNPRYEFTITSLEDIVHFSFTRVAASSNFEFYNWQDQVIKDVSDMQPRDLCQRRALIGPMVVARVIAFAVYYFVWIPIVYICKTLVVLSALLTGVKLSGINWNDYKKQGDIDLSIESEKRYNFFFSPLASICYFVIGFLVITSRLSPVSINLAIIVIILFNFNKILNFFWPGYKANYKVNYTKPMDNYLDGKSKKTPWMLFKINYSRAKKPFCKPIIKK